MKRLFRRILKGILGLRANSAAAARPISVSDAAAQRRHALRVRDETLARVTFGLG